MEHFKSPYGSVDFVSSRAIDNERFFRDVLRNAKNHRFFAHPFMSTFESQNPSAGVVSFVLTSFYKIVSPFTGLLCSLGGRAPNLRARFALMDNIFEEMGCGDLSAAHPSMYLKMLDSIGVSEATADAMPTLPSILRINEHLHDVVQKQAFAVACAVLASAEATIPPSFPVLAAVAKRAFPHVDMDFFDRHGPRDEGHSDDATMLFAVTADPSMYAAVEAGVKLDLDFRAELFDEWMAALTTSTTRRVSERPARPLSVRPPARDSVAPPA